MLTWSIVTHLSILTVSKQKKRGGVNCTLVLYHLDYARFCSNNK